MPANILYLDIENAPKLVYVWEFFKVNVSPKQVLEHGHIMSFSAIWNDDPADKIIYQENREDDDAGITSSLIYLLDQADVVIGQNINKFDLTHINGRAVVNKLLPPSPYKTVDTYQVARKELNMGSNSLEYLCNILDVPVKKKDHAKFPGFELWRQCLLGNNEAWDEMMEYNIDDTLAVREVYKRLRPYVRNHPNLAVYEESSDVVCSRCGSKHLVPYQHYYTNVGKYEQYRCGNCGSWCKSRYNQYPKEKRTNLVVAA